MSDAVLIAIATGITSLVGTCVTGYFGLQIVRANKSIKKTAETTLQHVNHQVIAQAKNYAISTRLNAELSGNSGYKRIADDAQSALEALVKAQESIDRTPSP